MHRLPAGQPRAGRNGWLIEQIARRPGTPNGTAELLIDAAMRAFALRDSTWATMGLVALSPNAGAAMARNPRWIRLATTWMGAHFNRFYNFRGIDAFRTRLRPQAWEPQHVITSTGRLLPHDLLPVIEAFTHVPPALFLFRAIHHGAAQEVRWITER